MENPVSTGRRSLFFAELIWRGDVVVVDRVFGEEWFHVDSVNALAAHKRFLQHLHVSGAVGNRNAAVTVKVFAEEKKLELRDGFDIDWDFTAEIVGVHAEVEDE